MRGILTTWVTCTLLLASVSGVHSADTTAAPTVSATSPTSTTKPTPPPPTTVTATTTTGSTSTGPTTTASTATTGSTITTTGSTGSTVTTTGSTGSTVTTTGSTGSTVTTTGSTGTTTTGTTTTTNGTDVETSTPGNETTSNTTPPGLVTTVGIASTTTARPGCAVCGNMPCLQLYNDYVCRCPINSIYMESIKGCFPGESLYGEVLLMDKDFEEDTTSTQYTDIYKELVNNFNESISNKTNFLGTAILEMRLASARNMRKVGNVLAKVTNIFVTDGVNRTEVEREIADYFKNQNLGTYTAKTVCESGWVCDPDTTTCTSDNAGYAVCSCKEGFYSSLLSPTACRECAPSCTEANGKQCVQGKTPKCSCLPGYKEKDGECKECSFGYSGDNCDDNFLLILVIVGSVLGGVVLILLGTVIGLAVKSGRRKGDSERAGLITKEDRRSPPASPQLGTIFPKVTMKPDLGEVNRGVNVYDDNEEYTRSMPQRDYDENPWYEMERRKRDY